MSRGPVVAIAGNPNSGKTTLFNALTGLRQHVGNYAGVTVERKTGTMFVEGRAITVVDLPGTYSLVSRARDETIAFEVLTGRAGNSRPALAIVVVDASNLDRNLYLALQVLELGIPTVMALNMMDIAEESGLQIDVARLSEELGVPVLPIVAVSGEGVEVLKRVVLASLETPPTLPPRRWRLVERDEAVIAIVRDAMAGTLNESLEGEAVWILSTIAVAGMSPRSKGEDDPLARERHTLAPAISAAERALGGDGAAFAARLIEARYAIATGISESVVRRIRAARPSATDRIDALLLHRIFGPAIFLVIMAVLFQSIFAWAEPLMRLIEDGFGAIGDGARSLLPQGALRDLFADGILGGVGNVLVFVPQIAVLFFFIAVLEDSGYLARAAYISDRLMAKVGLHGRAFVPLISGFACAIPAIMAARSIESTKDRLVTILVTPLMSCSARLPVYALIISALFTADQKVIGFLSVGGLLMFSMYALSVGTTVVVAFVLKRTVLKSPTPPLVLELPPYRMPRLGNVLRRVFDRCRVFVGDAGTVILACSVVLWGLLYFPRTSSLPFDIAKERSAIEATSGPGLRGDTEREEAMRALDARVSAERLKNSWAGRFGRMIEPAIEPLGYDWKIGIGLLASFAAREVLVSTLGLVYGIGRDADEANLPLREAIREERHLATGKRVYTPLTGLSLMVFFVLACQCMSTLAVVRRETASWRWPLFMFSYMTVLAWVGAFVVYQGGRALGFGA